jgi:ABC-type sugar transport system ATPase subunit
MTATQVSPQPLWELNHIYKSFPGVQALDDVSLSLYPGEVHALIGENGSGKSTLCKCVAGVYQPDSGAMLWQGQPVVSASPLEARQFGVATIYQEFSLIPTLSVTENIFLGRPLRRAGTLDWATMRRRTGEVLNQLDVHVDPDDLVRSLSVAEQQLVEIAKALSADSTLLIMDEPTAAIGLGETERLLALVRRLAGEGKAILYISHRLDEVFQVADVVTIFKDGKLVCSRQPVSALTMHEVVRMMVGVDVDQHYPKEPNTRPEVSLEVRDLHTENGVNGVSFIVHKGEVFGLGGMVGAGRTEIARAIFGLDKPTQGQVLLEGNEVSFSSPASAIGAGVGLVPEDRKADGLFFNFEAPPNITIARLRSLVRSGFLSLPAEQRVGKEYVGKLSITPAALEKSVQFLSGGNQQKVVIARWLYSNARLLIFDEPTRGIDIGAKLDVYAVINELTARGIGILLISSDYPELLAMSDRVAVVRDGRILHVAAAGELNEQRLTAIASGAEVGNLAGAAIDKGAIDKGDVYA